MDFLTVDGVRLEYELLRKPDIAPHASTIVFLHEGLGSIGQWRDFPHALAEASGCHALIYARRGHGNSDTLDAPRTPEFMHIEAFEVLPQILGQLQIERPILFGHSDGGSIALLFAGGGHEVRGLIVEAPHLFVEERSIFGIEAAGRAYLETDLRDKLERYHAGAETMFRGWNDVWLSAGFRAWNIEEFLPRILSPVLAIQGEQDAYGTMAQIDAVAAQVAGEVSLLKLEQCGHVPHREQTEKTLTAALRFIKQLPP
jgi:pimeloyl-ACP methyl ester carboxylesterase